MKIKTYVKSIIQLILFIVFVNRINGLSICYIPNNNTLLTYGTAPIEPNVCNSVPQQITIDSGTPRKYTFQGGISTIIGKDTINIRQQLVNNDAEKTTQIIFEKDNGLKSISLGETAIKCSWIITNENTGSEFVYFFAYKNEAWGFTKITAKTSFPLYIYTQSYELFELTRTNSDSFVFFNGINDTHNTLETTNKPYINTIRKSFTNDCIYQFSSYYIGGAGVNDGNYKMISICERNSIQRYVQCYWSKGSYTDCSCKPVSKEPKIKTSGNLKYPDCHYLSYLYDFSLNTENTYVEFDTVNTTSWSDFLIPQRMESLTLDITANGIDFLTINTDFSLPSFPFKVYGGLNIIGELTFETAADYYFKNLTFKKVMIDEYIDDNTIIFASIVNENDAKKLESIETPSKKIIQVLPTCGTVDTIRRFVKNPGDESSDSYLGCKCIVETENTFEQFDCEEVSKEPTSQLDLIISKSIYDGNSFIRYWNNIKFTGNGYRTLKGLRHNAKICTFIADRTYIIDTELYCDEVNIEKGVTIEVKGNFYIKTLNILEEYSNLNQKPIFISSPLILTDLSSISFTLPLQSCIELVTSSLIYNLDVKNFGDYSLVGLEHLLRVCPSKSINKAVECEMDGTNYPTNFINSYCPCSGSECSIKIPNTISKVMASTISSIEGKLIVSGDLSLSNFNLISTLEIKGQPTLVIEDTTELQINSINPLSESIPNLILQSPTIINGALNKFSITPSNVITFNYNNVQLEKVTETTTGSLILKPTVTSLSIEEIKTASSLNTIPLFILESSETPITISGALSSTSNKIILLTKSRQVRGPSTLSCDGQAILPTGFKDCNKIGLSSHKCYFNSNKYILSSSNLNIDYSCPCTRTDDISCSITIDPSSTSILVINSITEFIVESSITFTSNSHTFTIRSSSSDAIITINGDSNFIQVDAIPGFTLKSTSQNNVLSSISEYTFSSTTATSSNNHNFKKITNNGVIVVSSPNNYCTVGQLNDNTFLCLICGDITANSNGICTERKPIERCNNLVNGYCKECEEGYYVEGETLGSQSCQALQPGCLRGNSKECFKCVNGKKIHGTDCIDVNDCSFYLNELCILCEEGKRSSNSQTCDTTCDESCKSCHTIKDNEICNICNSDLKYSKAFDGNTCTTGEGADTVSPTYQITCSKGYSFDSSNPNKCNKCTAGCSICEGGKCLQCEKKEDILFNEACRSQELSKCKTIKDNKCIECNEQEYYDITTGTCTKYDSTCKSVDYNGLCTSCTNKEFYVELPERKKCVSNQQDMKCLSSLYGICYRCIPKYYPNGVKCEQCLEHCKLCSNESQCEVCEDGYQLINSTCVLLTTEHCEYYGTFSCIKCESGYYLDTLKCTECDSKCKECTSNNRCSLCNEGYYLNNSKCISLEEANQNHCTNISKTGCVSCEIGYYNKDGECLSCNSIKPNCAVCNITSNKCIKCPEEYIMKEEGCVHYSTILHCKQAIDGYCDKCDNWYALSYTRTSCERYAEGGQIAAIIICIIILISIIILIGIGIYLLYKRYQRRLEITRANGVFPLKHCNIELQTYPTLPTIVCETTIIEFSDKMELNKEYAKGFYIGNKGETTVEIQFTIKEDQRYRIEFSPSNVVIKPKMCCLINVLIMPYCSFNIQQEFKCIIKENNNKKGELNFKFKANTIETYSIDPELIQYQNVLRANYEITVSKAIYNNTPVIVRNIGCFELGIEEKKIYEEPLNILETFPSSNYLTKYIGKVLLKNTHLIITEFAPLGTLQDIINSKKSSINSVLKQRIILDASKGIAILHARNYLHYNIKPSNILLISTNINDQSLVKITDFGYHYNYKKFFNHRIEVSERPTYIAPEIFTGQKFTNKTDVYAFALTMFAIITLNEPYPITEYPYPWSISKFVCVGRRLPQPLDMSKQMYDIISNSWEHCSADRFTMDEIVHELKKLSLN
ncbi:serine-threonine protein kinase, putative [Entamoeba dispar SAW760]|uniref:Serine-threonine protein kinase, putative n=1 Tax=Entamoeba dispar (strain ATCC PRA-260 / SAW760) TaxID=370354 RepID=B0EKN9_ENTDS|nr:serine-threonine protein kinase, putative [Entamoeba dispar SAW760]EDR24909.1 serine-threonine protein kinase, putative [Entamoeba dispar SAW760]|eukprot:EDR24909.1 serine-threonine protein kinase, putative [Entamoeba dispar SAW760]